MEKLNAEPSTSPDTPGGIRNHNFPSRKHALKVLVGCTALGVFLRPIWRRHSNTLISLHGQFPKDPAYGWKDDIWPIRPQTPWDISSDFNYTRKLTYEVEEGTWLRLDVSPTGDIVFDMLGDIYCIPSDAYHDPSLTSRAYPVLVGVPYDSDPHFSPDGSRLAFRSDAGLGVENIFVKPWSSCREAALRSYAEDIELRPAVTQALSMKVQDESLLRSGIPEDVDRRTRRLIREGRDDAFRVTNETYRWVSDPRWHPTGKHIIATKWYTSSRSLGAGEGWVYEVPDVPHPVASGSGIRVQGRDLPFGWSADQYEDQQIGPEQFIWWGEDRIIFSKNVAETDVGFFEYSKDVYKGIYAIFSRNLTTGHTETLVQPTPGGASRPELSKDGKTLAFVRRVRDKEALVLLHIRSGTLHNIWYGLTYDLSNVFAPMGTYPSFSFTADDSNIVIWAAGSIWRVPLAVNSFGEKVAGGEPVKISFIATIEKALADLRVTETDLVKEHRKQTSRIYAFKELAVDATGSNVAFRAGARTYVHRQIPAVDSGHGVMVPQRIPSLHSDGTYYSPSFVPHIPHLIIQAHWSDKTLSSLELADLERDIVFDLSEGLPQGRYDHPVICECEGLNRRIAFVRKGGDDMTGHVVATANPGIYVGSITLPSPFGIPDNRKIRIRDVKRVSIMVPSRLKFTDGARRLLAHTDQAASVIDLSAAPDNRGFYPAETIAEGKMSQEIAVTQPPAVAGAHGVLSGSTVENVAFVDFFQVHIAPGRNVNEAVWSKPGPNATKGLARVSVDGGHDLAWSGDGKKLFWFLGPYLHSLEVERLSRCNNAIKSDPSTFGIDCIRTEVGFSEVYVSHASESAQLKSDAIIAYSEANPEVNNVPSTASAIVIINATVVTMKTGHEIRDTHPNTAIIIIDGIIETVGTNLGVPIGAKIIDAQGGVVLPGFVDVHAHWNGAYTVASSYEQETFLAYGCTTMHNPSSDTVDTWTERARIESGDMVGPRLFTTGTIIYGAGEPQYHQDIADEAEARSALIRLKVEGGPFAFSYKNYNQPSRASRQRLIKQAGKLGMNVYPEGGMNFDWDITYILDGMTTVEHSLPIPKLYDDVMNLFALSGTGNTPTHIVNYGGIFGEVDVWARERVPFDEKLRRFIPHSDLEVKAESVAAPRDAYQFRNTSSSVYEMTKRYLNANIGAHGEPPIGLNYHEEMFFFTEGGMTPFEAFRSATRMGAKSLGLFGSIGSIEPGKLGDLVIYPPGVNVLEDISASRHIRYVVKGGRIWDASTMVEVWPMKGRKQVLPPFNAD